MRVKKDSGYAWVILAATFGCNYLLGVLVYTTGLIHLELLRTYEDDVTGTAWAGALYSSLPLLAGNSS